MHHFIYLCSTIILVFLAFFILSKKFKSSTNRIFVYLILSISGWVFTLYIYYFFSFGLHIFIGKLNFAFAELIAYFAFWFGYYFPEKTFEIKKINKIFLKIFTLLLILITLFSDFIVKDEIIKNGKLETIFGKGYLLFVLYFLILIIFHLGFISYKYKKAEFLKKQQIKFLALGAILSVSVGIFTNIILPLFFNYFKLQHATPLIALFYCSIIFYTIINYRLMDIRIVARKIFIYVCASVFAYIFFYFLVWFYSRFFGNVFSKPALFLGIFIAPAFVVGLLGIINLLKNFANKYLFFSLYNYQEAINKLSQELNYYTDLDKIIDAIVDSVKKTMQLDRAGILLIDRDKKNVRYKIAKVVGFNEKNGISLVENSFLTKYLKKTRRLLVREELSLLAKEITDKKDKESFLKLFGHMKKIEASVCLPLLSGNELIGIAVLGSKISNDPYTKEDLELLSTLSNQAGIAIDNARLYQEVKEFSKTLQNKVNEQTKDLQKTNKDLQVQNKLNKELLEMKSDFLRVVNHQLNTPLSVMKGYFSMMEEKSYTPKQAFPAIKSSLERINQTVSDFWEAYELEGERIKMDFQKVDITSIIKKLLEEKKNIIKNKGGEISITLEKPSFKVPLVWCDYKKIAHVISNLLDNAVFYTYKGKVSLSYKLIGENYLKIIIKDTGVGLSENDQKNLFQKFSRGKKASGMHPDGSGLGLYIARKIIEGNNGEISVQSKGTGKGSLFNFTIPIYKNQKAEKGDIETVQDKKIELFL